MSAPPLDWDAAAYDRVADPQEAWAREIVARMGLRGDELVLDAGCGSGRVTRLLLERLPRGRLIAVDCSPSMVARARETLGLPDGDRPATGHRVLAVQCQDLLELRLPQPVDAIFSCAVFHHIQDHERLFARLRAALRDGGRLAAQCGGAGNIERFRALADAVARQEPYARYLDGMEPPWHYAGPGETERRLRAAGFSHARCWLEPKHTVPPEPAVFARAVLLNYHLHRLRRRAPAGEAERLTDAFADDVLSGAGDRLELDYVRLNVEAEA